MTTPQEPQRGWSLEKAQDNVADPARAAETQVYRPGTGPAPFPQAQPQDAGPPQYTPPGGYPAYPTGEAPSSYPADPAGAVAPSHPAYPQQSIPTYPQQGYPQQGGYPQQPGYPQAGGAYGQPGYPQPAAYGYPPQYGGPGYQPYGPYGPPRSDTPAWSIASFVCLGITAVAAVLCFIPIVVTAPAGIIFGIVGHSKGEQLGKWAAIANGVVLALAIVLVVAVVGIAGIGYS